MRPDVYRLVAIDLDGTLLDSEQTVPERNRAALAACELQGIRVAIVTGRRFPAARRFIEALPTHPVVVANSGAIIKESVSGRILRRRFLPAATAALVLDIAIAAGEEPLIHDGPDAEGHLILREAARRVPHVGRYLHQTLPAPIFVPEIRLERDPVQIGFASSIERIRSLERGLDRALADHRDRVAFARTEYEREDLALLDVLSSDATKSSALSYLARHLGVPLATSVAIGDNWNDLDMLEAAGLGIVMANAAKALRSRGFAATTSNDRAGVAEALRRYVLTRAH